MGTVTALRPKEENRYPGIAEAPRFSCALGGAYMATLATFGAVPILHSGAGCGMSQNFGQNFAAGLNGAGPQGNTSTPCSCLVEEHAVFGGEDKLRALIQSTTELVRGDLFAVVSGCVPALIGDDVGAVVKEFREKVPILHVNTAGFVGNSYKGYEQYLDAVIDQLLTPQTVVRKRVNLLGVVPYQHIFWKGNLQVLKDLLAAVGVEANMIFTEPDGLEALRRIPSAELNLVFSPWSGVPAARKLKEKFGTPFAVIPSVPVGPKDTSQFLQFLARRLQLRRSRVEAYIAKEEARTYRFAEYMADIAMMALPNAYTAVVADTGTAIGLTRYGSNELGWLPEIVIVTDDPPEESREEIVRSLTEGLESAVKPEVHFEIDAHKIRLLLREHTVQLVLASSLEKYLAVDELDAMQLSVAFPAYDRLIVDRTYAGYRGGLALMEDIAYKYGGPL
ncbi:nitrogenase component 1 [Geomesophilobacter sediminis]|uniref:Nitrogenase n=1 Tax=Geomesophilobacter sediminis TaxID=2798584 RepID=A0A8J7IX68_9BACT|nr:nitrogenase component 1 [Geomesophilobacter sediminis]MBJ6724382.1 nitrogenase [Geomesophilobacter sediminis]